MRLPPKSARIVAETPNKIPLRVCSSGKQPKNKYRNNFLIQRSTTVAVPRASVSPPKPGCIRISAVNRIFQQHSDKWKTLKCRKVFSDMLIRIFVNSPVGSSWLPPKKIGVYPSLDANIAETILPRADPRFQELRSFLGNTMGVFEDYWPWSTLYVPLIFSSKFPIAHRLLGFKDLYQARQQGLLNVKKSAVPHCNDEMSSASSISARDLKCTDAQQLFTSPMHQTSSVHPSQSTLHANCDEMLEVISEMIGDVDSNEVSGGLVCLTTTPKHPNIVGYKKIKL